MFEKFPQLKRLERLLNKAQGFSPNHSKNAAQRKTSGLQIFIHFFVGHGLNDSPIDILQDTTKGTQPRYFRHSKTSFEGLLEDRIWIPSIALTCLLLNFLQKQRDPMEERICTIPMIYWILRNHQKRQLP